MSVVEKQNAADYKPSFPISIEVKRPRGGATFGMTIPLNITIRNSSNQAIWVDE